MFDDWATICATVIASVPCASASEKVVPATEMLPGTPILVAGVTRPRSIAAEMVAIFMTEPGS